MEEDLGIRREKERDRALHLYSMYSALTNLTLRMENASFYRFQADLMLYFQTCRFCFYVYDETRF